MHTYDELDPDAVNQISNDCKSTADEVNMVIQIITAAIYALQATNFFSLGTNTAQIAFLEVIKKLLEEERDKLNQLADDALIAIKTWEERQQQLRGLFNRA